MVSPEIDRRPSGEQPVSAPDRAAGRPEAPDRAGERPTPLPGVLAWFPAAWVARLPPSWRAPWPGIAWRNKPWRHPLVITTVVLMTSLLAVVGWLAFRVDPPWGGAWIAGDDERTQEEEPPAFVAGHLPAAPDGPGVRMQSGRFGGYGHFAWDHDFDGEVVTVGVNAQNGAYVARYAGSTAPTLADCAATARDDWSDLAPAEQLRPGAHFCYVTSEDRYGFFTVQRATVSGTQLRSLEATFLTWQGLED